MRDPSLPDDLADHIRRGAGQMAGVPEDLPVDDLVRYLKLLQTWGKAYNLTAVHDPEKMVTHHILDSLAVLPFISGSYCLDVGTGAGLPGLVLALAKPDTEWVLLDSNRKKIRFVIQVIMELGIKNVTAVCSRVENWRNERGISCIVVRAFSSLNEIYAKTCHLLSPDSCLLAMKGSGAEQEVAALKECVSAEIHTLHIPGLNNLRAVVEIRPLPTGN